jgi:hypothetical protein
MEWKKRKHERMVETAEAVYCVSPGKIISPFKAHLGANNLAQVSWPKIKNKSQVRRVLV